MCRAPPVRYGMCPGQAPPTSCWERTNMWMPQPWLTHSLAKDTASSGGWKMDWERKKHTRKRNNANIQSHCNFSSKWLLLPEHVSYFWLIGAKKPWEWVCVSHLYQRGCMKNQQLPRTSQSLDTMTIKADRKEIKWYIFVNSGKSPLTPSHSDWPAEWQVLLWQAAPLELHHSPHNLGWTEE